MDAAPDTTHPRVDVSLPLLLIDVDGVLNVEPSPARPPGDWRTHRVRGPLVAEYDLHLNPAHGQWLSSLAELFELVWCTTWGRVANERISPIVGLPDDMGSVRMPGAWSGLPREHSPKTPWVRRHAQGRAVAWVDDECDDRDAEALVRNVVPGDRTPLAGTPACKTALVLAIDPTVGLTYDQISQLRTWGQTQPR